MTGEIVTVFTPQDVMEALHTAMYHTPVPAAEGAPAPHADVINIFTRERLA